MAEVAENKENSTSDKQAQTTLPLQPQITVSWNPQMAIPGQPLLTLAYGDMETIGWVRIYSSYVAHIPLKTLKIAP